MAKNVIINGVTYSDVPYVNIPLAAGEDDATFYDTSNANVTSADIRAGKTAYGASGAVQGSVAAKTSSDLTVNGATITAPAGIYDSSASASVATGSVTPSTTLTGTVIGTTVSDYSVTASPSASVSAGYITSAGSGTNVTKYIQVENKTVTPSTSQQTINPSTGKLISGITVNAVSLTGDATAADVLSGKTFYNTTLTKVTGTATVPTVSQDSTTKALTIM